MALLKNNENSIVIQTRKRREITNFQETETSPLDTVHISAMKKKYPFSIMRTEPNPFYNCHGLTFGSRRSRIYKTNEISWILGDDGYIEIPDCSAVLPGDIVIYREDGVIEHSGIVIEKPEGYINIPKVLSKWGGYGEVIHGATYCPYGEAQISYYRVCK